ncbi:hypothetical protein FRC07_013910, partial [Ceratobasidium sp. 392]
MPAVNVPFAPLVERYRSINNIPTYDAKDEKDDAVWGGFPFNCAQFCALTGLELNKGFSVMPSGPDINLTLQPKVRSEWARHLPGGREFLVRCDQAVREYFESTSNPTFEHIHDTILKTAPGRADWTWLVTHTWDAPGGFNHVIERIMRDNECDAEYGFRKARLQQVRIDTQFGKSDLTRTVSHQQKATHLASAKGKERATFLAKDIKVGNTYESVWPDSRNRMLEHLFGEDAFYSSEHADEDLAKVHNMGLYGIARALTARVYERAMGRIERALNSIQSDTATLEKAYKAAEEKPNRRNLQSLMNRFEAISTGYRLLGRETQAEEHRFWEGQCTELMARLGRKVVDGKIVNVDATHASASTIPVGDIDKVFRDYQQSLVRVRSDAIPEIDENDYDDLEMEEDVAAARAFNAGFHPDAGVEHWKGVTYEEICAKWGLVDQRLPGSNENGRKPTWHQLVGATEIVQRAF